MQDCSDCRFYASLYKNSETGHCKRYAPRPFPSPSGMSDAEWSFPAVAKDDWCGELEPRAQQGVQRIEHTSS